MTPLLVLSRRIRLIFHTLGLSCIGGALFLQTLVFSDIAQQGYFVAVELNSVVLSFEIILTVFAIIYFVYIYQRLLRSVR